jgi:putative toxin-antitoxin system antitoxin component (TIGR02293 family)
VNAAFESAATARTLVEATQLSAHQLACLLALSAPAYERRRRDDSFSRTQRAKLVRVVNVIERARRVLGDGTRARQWLVHPNRALHLSTPLALLGTKAGAQRVFEILLRIESGSLA